MNTMTKLADPCILLANFAVEKRVTPWVRAATFVVISTRQEEVKSVRPQHAEQQLLNPARSSVSQHGLATSQLGAQSGLIALGEMTIPCILDIRLFLFCLGLLCYLNKVEHIGYCD